MIIVMEVNVRTRCCGERGRMALAVVRADARIFEQIPKVKALRDVIREQMIEAATRAIDLILGGVQ